MNLIKENKNITNDENDAEFVFLISKWLESYSKDSFLPLIKTLDKDKAFGLTTNFKGHIRPCSYNTMKLNFPTVPQNHIFDLLSKLKHPTNTPNPPHNQNMLKTAHSLQSENPTQFLEMHRSDSFHLYRGYRRLKTIFGHTSPVFCVGFHENGRHFFSGSDDKLVKIWDLKTGLLLRSLKGHHGEITDLVLSPGGKILASASADCSIRLWAWLDNSAPRVLAKHTKTVHQLKFLPGWSEGRKHLLSCSEDGFCIIWDLRDLDSPARIKAVTYPIFLYRVYFPKYGRKNTGSFSSVAAGNEVSSSRGSRGKKATIYAIEFGSKSGEFFCGGSGGFLFALRFEEPFFEEKEGQRSEKVLQQLKGHKSSVTALAYRENRPAESEWLFSGSHDGTTLVWTRKKGAPLFQCAAALPFKRLVFPPGVSDVGREEMSRARNKQNVKVDKIALSCDSKWLAVSGCENVIQVWGVSSLELRHCLRGHEGGRDIWVLQAHPTEPRLLLSGGHDGRVVLWDMAGGKRLKKFRAWRLEMDTLLYGCFNKSGTLFLCGNNHGRVTVFGFGSRQRLGLTPAEQFFADDYTGLEIPHKEKVLVDSNGRRYIKVGSGGFDRTSFKRNCRENRSVIDKRFNQEDSDETSEDVVNDRFQVADQSEPLWSNSTFELDLFSSEDERVRRRARNPSPEIDSEDLDSDFEPFPPSRKELRKNTSESSSSSEDNFRGEKENPDDESIPTEATPPVRTRSGREVKKPPEIFGVVHRETFHSGFSRRRKAQHDSPKVKTRKLRSNGPLTSEELSSLSLAKRKSPLRDLFLDDSEIKTTDTRSLDAIKKSSVKSRKVFTRSSRISLPQKDLKLDFSSILNKPLSNDESGSDRGKGYFFRKRKGKSLKDFSDDFSEVSSETEESKEFKDSEKYSSYSDKESVSEDSKVSVESNKTASSLFSVKELQCIKPSNNFVPQVGDAVVYLEKEHLRGKMDSERKFPLDYKQHNTEVESINNIDKPENYLECVIIGIKHLHSEDNKKSGLFLDITLSPTKHGKLFTVRYFKCSTYLVKSEVFHFFRNYKWKVGQKVNWLINGSSENFDAIFVKVVDTLHVSIRLAHQPNTKLKVFPWDLKITALEESFSQANCKNELDLLNLSGALLNYIQADLAFSPHSKLFLKSVNLNLYPEYPSSVALPIDIGIISSRVENKYYRSLTSFFSDVQLLVKNSVCFNGIDSFVTEDAVSVENEVFENLVSFLEERDETENSNKTWELGYMKCIYSQNNEILNLFTKTCRKILNFESQKNIKIITDLIARLKNRDFFDLNELKACFWRTLSKNDVRFGLGVIDTLVKKLINATRNRRNSLIACKRNERRLRTRNP